MKERNGEEKKDRGQKEVRGETKILDKEKDRKAKKQRQKEVAWETGSKEGETDRHQALCLGSPSFPSPPLLLSSPMLNLSLMYSCIPSPNKPSQSTSKCQPSCKVRLHQSSGCQADGAGRRWVSGEGVPGTCQKMPHI